MAKLCEYCGKSVKERTDRTVRFCSISCANKSRRKNFPKPCGYCGETFQPPGNHPKQKYCSTACRDMALTTQVTVPCDYCGKPSKHKRNRFERLKHHFCDRGCMLVWLHENAPSGSDHPQYNRVTVTCVTCGKQFERCPSQLRDHNFCGVECRTEWQRASGYSTGENSPTWLGGYIDHRGPNWDKQAEKARKRDSYTCQRCGLTQEDAGQTLDVHHVIPWRDFGNDWKHANQLSNLITYCTSCHQTVEWETGSKAVLCSQDTV